MTVVTIPVSQIQNWDSFHKVFATALGFPDFYGCNMDAWIDSLSGADTDDGMRNVVVPVGSMLTLDLGNIREFRQRCPDQHKAIVDCAAFVNWRRIERGLPAVLALSFCS